MYISRTDCYSQLLSASLKNLHSQMFKVNRLGGVSKLLVLRLGMNSGVFLLFCLGGGQNSFVLQCVYSSLVILTAVLIHYMSAGEAVRLTLYV